ncbi:TetR/AcrR family transcriptional regulator [Pseudomonas sp. NBRC 100443]|uniref:TetR/AcrR family transcriptional regulator n=1 Tax=Pseudomonas sp. NBRC 100443 TaxID=1113665 RepID=UPI0024A17B0E|nr:TetR/AcrR family transcriptional regulator [Pseudomonas sp. NBRC 100443]GLU37366.1 hypothetical protein Pssp01_14590 [Pseudomonas sp. NBRC 100443]
MREQARVRLVAGQVAHGVGRPRKDEVPERLRHLRKLAMQHFIAHGYEGASLEQIALAAGISKVTIYRHYIDKADLFRSVVLEASAELLPDLGQVLEEDLPIEEALLRFALSHVNLVRGHGRSAALTRELARLLIAEAARLPDSVGACRKIFFERSCVPLANYLRRQTDKGRLILEDPEFVAAYFIQATFFANADLLGEVELEGQEARISRCVRMFLHGCVPRPCV